MHGTEIVTSKKRGRRLLLMFLMACCLVMCATMAQASFSGLALIPTAETVGAGNYSLEAQFDCPLSHPHFNDRVLNIEFGLGSSIEAGIDMDIGHESASQAAFNAKYLFPTGSDRHAFAVGVCNVGNSLLTTPYATAMRSIGKTRLHFGGMTGSRHLHWFAGLDRQVADAITVMADYTSGDENFSSLGLSYQVTKSFDILAGVQLANTGSDHFFTLHMVLSGPLHSNANASQ